MNSEIHREYFRTSSKVAVEYGYYAGLGSMVRFKNTDRAQVDCEYDG